MKKSFFAGLAILLPMVLTAWIFIFLINLLTSPFTNLAALTLSYFPAIEIFNLKHHDIVFILSKLLILVFLFLFILFIGFLVRILVFTSLFNLSNSLFEKIPFFKTIYKGTRDILTSILSGDKGENAFKHPILVPFPTKDSHSVGFLVGKAPKECQERANSSLDAIFLPVSPHPFSGFIILCPTSLSKKIEMTNEEALKFMVSCGLVLPDAEEKERKEQTT